MATDEKLSAAQKLLKELRVHYLNDLPAQFSDLEQRVMTITDAAAQGEDFEALYLRVHSLKGTAGSYGLSMISAICHQLEDLLNRAQEEPLTGRGFVDQALEYVDLLRRAQLLARQDTGNYAEIELALAEIKSRASGKPLSGMIIDTSRVSVEMWLRLLADAPIQFSVMEDGLAALDRLLHEPFDLLITGMEIPNLNGTALIAAVRLARGINSRIKTILVSSRETPALPEPLRPDRIVRRDARFLERMRETVQELVEEIQEARLEHQS